MRTENKLDYPYVENGSKLMEQKKCKKEHSKEWVACLQIIVIWVQDLQKDGTGGRLRL